MTLVVANAAAHRALRPTCGANLTLPQTGLSNLKPIPYTDYLGCKEGNATCFRALNVIIHYAGGLLGWRNVSESPPYIYGVGPAAQSCLSHDDAVVHAYPCVSAPFVDLSYRDSCALYVHAGCVGTSKEPWSRVGCQMHPGSRLRLRGVDDRARLAGEWVVGPGRTTAQEGNTFWIFRADGEPHGLEPDELAAILERRRSAAASTHFQCVLDTQRTTGESCCHRRYDYGTCAAPDPLGNTAPELGGMSIPLKRVFVDVGIGSVVVLLAVVLYCACRRCGVAQRMRFFKQQQQQLLSGTARRCDAGTQAESRASMQSQPPELSPAEVTCREVQISLAELPSWDVMYVETDNDYDECAARQPDD